ncbi:hypothetical protein L3Y34_018919 [Caenorhabditis briggsae]|uniref:5'-3' exoribonuclease 1 n=1 Tax=Caenorhabditis briggsae TaxID=6238 RepID=A0AAE9IVG5_CAEBR|nr:hypothetical protein L3Y34_018919 [Caenorhabditis briggsae]
MGVPKFYRWTSERYPCLSEVINESQIPEFDNLYLDMNGIIHNCSHPNDDDVTFRITEEEIFVNIFAYIENLYNLIKPQKVFFMAVDGVAPRAKMNQQRARRFMSARTAQTQMDQAIAKGEVLPSEKRFDSNCITPGTYFMTRLHEKLDAWVREKSVSDTRWQGRKIILSGHNVPGEGEHKIMDFIRSERAGTGYDPNTRHCMYGLDADLIMLGIVSHEPHFSLLREEVTFNTRPRKNDQKKKPKRTDSEVKTFHLLHLSLLREYLAWEFADVKESLPFEYDMERIVDDWIMMGLLVGNDFLPHLPSIHIHDDALPLLYSTYKKVLPSLDGYINESGYLNLARFEKFLAQLSLNDKNCFMDKLEDDQFMESKKLPRNGSGEEEEELVAFESSDIEDEEADGEKEDSSRNNDDHDAAFVSDHEEDKNNGTGKTSAEESPDYDAQFLEEEFNDELATLALSGMDDADFANNVEACWTKAIDNQFKRHKKYYYSDKLRYKNISKAELRAQAEGYVRAIQWNLHYYYHGCVSWSWFYPHHYAPFISDVQGFADMKIEFELSKPFQPFEQLLAVLPEASRDCLPRPLQELMSSDPAQSAIHDFYPSKFETDLNGKKNDWEAVVLIPFIEEKRLLEAIESKQNRLSQEEKMRNTHGCHIQVISTRQGGGEWKMDRQELSQEIFRIPKEQVKWGLLPNVKMDVYFPGFPTMKHLSHSGKLSFANCNIFGMASRKESMVLKVENEKSDKDIIEWGSELCDEEVCIDWPILKLAKVDSIWGGDDKIVRKVEGDDDIIVKDMTEEEKKQWQSHVNQLTERMMTRYAIEIAGQKDGKGKHIRPALAWVRKFTGLVYETNEGSDSEGPTLKAVKQWSGPTSLYPVLLPLVVKDVLLENSRFLADLPVSLAYPLQSVVWLLDPKASLFGMPGMVNGYRDQDKSQCCLEVIGMTDDNRVDIMENLRKDSDRFTLRWMGGYDCARQCQIDVRLFARITGTMMLWNEPRESVETGQQISSDSKINCGLSLKYSRRDICLADFTDRIETVNARGVTSKVWFYTPLTCALVTEYKKRFPELIKYFESVGMSQTDDVYYTEDIWKNEKQRDAKFAELKEFLSNLPSHDAEQLKCGTEYADRQIISEIERRIHQLPPKKKRAMTRYFVPPSMVFRFELYDGKVQMDPEADFLILDRVASMSPDTKLPRITQGTVVGIHDDKIDVLFDDSFEGGNKVRGSTLASACRISRNALVNITFGIMRKKTQKKKPEIQALEGGYSLLKPKNAKPQDKNKEQQSTSSNPKDQNQKNSFKKEKNQKKEKKFDNKKQNENTPETLTNSLNELLKIKPRNAVPVEVESQSTSEAPSTTTGKQVSLMELLGGSGAKKAATTNPKIPKKPHGSKNLEEIEATSSGAEKESSGSLLLQQLTAAQNGSKNQKNPKHQKKNEDGQQKKNENSKNAKNSKNSKGNKNQMQQKVEILRKPSPTQGGSARASKTPSPPVVNEKKSSQQKNPPPPPSAQQKPHQEPTDQKRKTPSPPLVNQPQGPFPSAQLPGHFQPHPMGMFPPGMMHPMGMHMGMMHPHHPQQHQQHQGYDGKRQNPTLTDFKPSVISRRPNYRNQPPKVTMITKRKSPTPPDAPKVPVVETAPESSEEKTKKPRKKKQSRLAINFSNPSPST